MRSIGLIALTGAISLAAGLSRADDAAPPKKEPQFCVQVIACGTKDSKRRQYPTPCDARADGATDVAPMEGATCS
jgi:hypothetical protein